MYECNSNERGHMFDRIPLREPCKEVVANVSLLSLKPIGLVSSISPKLFSLALSLQCFLIKPMDGYIISRFRYTMGFVNILMAKLQGNVNKFDRS